MLGVTLVYFLSDIFYFTMIAGVCLDRQKGTCSASGAHRIHYRALLSLKLYISSLIAAMLANLLNMYFSKTCLCL